MSRIAIPDNNEIRFLDTYRDAVCVSLYMPTIPTVHETIDQRALFRLLCVEALRQMNEAGCGGPQLAAFAAHFRSLADDGLFWTRVPEGLAIFVALREVFIYRLPFAPQAGVEVSDRFHIKPLVMESAAAGNCYLLALDVRRIRFFEVTPHHHREIAIPGLPADMAGGADKGGDRAATSEVCRAVDRALGEVLAGRNVPLVLAGPAAITAVYRVHNTNPHLARTVVNGSAAHASDEALVREARAIAARTTSEARLRDLAGLAEMEAQRMASRNLDEIALAAVRGDVLRLLVDPAFALPGRVESASGRVDLAGRPGATTYDVFDELIGLTVRNGGEVVPISLEGEEDDDSGLAAIFRRSGPLH